MNTLTWGLDLSGSLQGAGGVGGLLVQTAVTGGVIERASYDGNGNITAWTKSNAAGTTSRREYDAFGNTQVSEGITPCTFGFSTKMQDGETGLYYYGYRFYDPVMGRWLNRDPIEERGGINLYGFVNNEAIASGDYLGLKICHKNRFTKKFKIKLPDFLKDLDVKGEAGVRFTTEECTDGTSSKELDFFGSLKLEGPVRAYGIPLAIGDNGLFGTGSLELHGKGKATWCGE